jgi:hypothetical protein
MLVSAFGNVIELAISINAHQIKNFLELLFVYVTSIYITIL